MTEKNGNAPLDINGRLSYATIIEKRRCKMKKKGMFIFVIGVLFTVLAAAPGVAAEEKVSWVFNWGAAPALSADGAAYAPGGRFERLLLKKSNGRFSLRIRERMVPRDQELDFLASGKAQIGDMSVTYVAGTYPLLDFGALPFRFSSLYEYEECVQDPEMKEIFEKVLRNAGLQYLAQIPAGAMMFIYAKKPIEKADDFKGLKIRTTGAVATKAFELLGAAPVSIPGPEMADALYRGVVDAAVTTLDYGMEQGLGDLVSHISVWKVMPLITTALVANARAFDALPSDLQQILRETAGEISAQQYYAAEPEHEAYKTWVGTTKIKMVYPAKEEILKARELTHPTVDDWLKVAGPYGQKVLDVSAKYIPK
jgi:TRAP-type C4-dicarboxylate transport system substrate-binding protein